MAITTTNALYALLYIYDGLNDSRWNYVDAVGTPEMSPGGLGHGVSLTYSFPESLPAYASHEISFQPMDAAMQAAAEQALAHVSELVNIDFTRVGDQEGQITFATSETPGYSAWAYVPVFSREVDADGIITSVSEIPISGSVWFNNLIAWNAAELQPGGFGYSLMLHELGHALGLKHPFFTNQEDGYILDWTIDNEAYTVMSYTHAPRTAVLHAAGSDGEWNISGTSRPTP